MSALSIERDGVRISATYAGGAYIELSFDPAPPPPPNPTEVLNVWDHENARPEIGESLAELAAVLEAWAADLEADGWTSWAVDYLANAR